MNRLGLKISCFLVSVLIWIQVATTEDVEQTTTLPLRVTGLDGTTVAGSEYLPEEVGVKVTGRKWTLLTHNYFNRYIGEVRVNLAGYSDSTFHLIPNRSQVSFSEDFTFQEFKPPVTLKLTVDLEITRLRPVALTTSKSLPDGLVFVNEPRILPDSVQVTGPSRYFSDEVTVSATAVDLSKLNGDTDLRLDLEAPSLWLELDHSEVQASFRIGKLETRTLANIPVIGLVDAGRPEVGISPPVADVMVEGFIDWVQALSEDEVSVVVKTGNLEEGVYFLEGEVVCPDWVTASRLAPSQFQVIVGNPPLLREGPRNGSDQEDQGE